MDPRARKVLQLIVLCLVVGFLTTLLLQRAIDGMLERTVLIGMLWLGLLIATLRNILATLQPRAQQGPEPPSPSKGRQPPRAES